jgi:hypothetical protein
MEYDTFKQRKETEDVYLNTNDSPMRCADEIEGGGNQKVKINENWN